MSDLVSEVVSHITSDPPDFALEKSTASLTNPHLNSYCTLTSNSPNFQFTLKGEKPLTLTQSSAETLFSIALTDRVTPYSQTRVLLQYRTGKRTWKTIGLLFQGEDAHLSPLAVRDWMETLRNIEK